MLQFGRIIYVAGLVLALVKSVASAGTVSITDSPVYTSQRLCAQNCFHLVRGPDAIADRFDCDYPYQNDCVCRADLQGQVDAYLASCVNRYCSGASVDVSSATSIYDNYCTSAGYLRADVAASPTTTTGTTGTGTASRTAATAFTATSTSSSSLGTGSSSTSSDSNSESNTFGGLSLSELIGVIVGIGGFIASAIGAWYTYKAVMHKREQHHHERRSHGTPSYYQQPQRQQRDFRMKPIASTNTTSWAQSPPPQYNTYGGYNFNR